MEKKEIKKNAKKGSIEKPDKQKIFNIQTNMQISKMIKKFNLISIF